MPKIIRILIVLFGLALLLSGSRVDAKGPWIGVLTIKGTVNPVLTDYIHRGLQQAQEDGASAIIIRMDTPGGLDTAMREIIQDILNSQVPVIVYVSPSGARAASAGVYITMSAHVAAMAPNTVIGAATPVELGGQASPEMMSKIVNDAAAYMRSLAEQRGRNADWGEKAVREAISATENEALALKVIDMLAPDLDSLLAQLNGRQVSLLGGQKVILNTQGIQPSFINMTVVELFLYTIADPNIAYLLMSLAALGIFIEVTNPGLIFPGVIGAISGILAFYSLGQLPVNIAGVLLIALAFILFAIEAFTAGFGLLFTGGIVSLLIGSLILFKGASAVFQISPWVIALVILVLVGVFFFIIQRVVQAHRRRPSTGREELVGKTAVVRKALEPEGMVFFEGELWSAISDSGRLEAGEEVIVTRVEGLKLWVTRKSNGGKE